MSRKPPLRTYERRNPAKKAVLLCGPSSSVLRGKKSTAAPRANNTFDIESSENDSLGYDPFDTTFDRLARNARLPPAPLNNEETLWHSSSNYTSEDEVAKDDESVLQVSIDLSNRNKLRHSCVKTQNKSIHKCMSRRKVPTQVAVYSKRKNLSRSGTRTVYSTKAFKKLKKDTSTKLEQERKEKMVIKQQLTRSLNISTMTMNDLPQRDKSENTQNLYRVEHGAMDLLLDIKPCSVKLQDLYEDKENVKYIENLGKSAETTILLTSNSELAENTKMKPNVYKSKTISLYNEDKVKKCFVKLERLERVFNEKNVIGNPKANAMCSTPMHNHRSRGLHFPLLSPIPIYCNEKRAILKEELNNGSRNETDKSSISLRLKDSDTTKDSYTSRKHSRSINSVEILCHDDASLTELMSIKNDQDSCYDQLKNVDNEECILEEYASTQKYLKTVGERKKDANGISLTDKSESLIEVIKSDIKSSSSIQNNEYSDSDMFSQTGISYSLMCESIAGKVSGDEDRANFTSKDITESIEAKSIDAKETHETQLSLKRNKTDLETILSRTLSIEIQESRNDSGQIKNDKSISLLEFSSQKNFENNSFQQLRVVVQRLQDPVRITNRRKQYRKWTLALSRISGESGVPNNISNIPESIEENAMLPRPSNVEKSIGNTSVIKTDLDPTSRNSRKSFFLQRGKSWARSLSILNYIQNGIDTDGTFHGKGQKWCRSVRNLLDMQEEGLLESRFTQTENITRESLQIANTKLNGDSNTRPCTGILGQISARMSVRVIRTGKPARNTEDASFLEAYGILPTITDTQRSTIPRQTLTNNIDTVTNLSQLPQNYCETKAKDAVLNRCKQTDFLPFEKYFSESYLGCCRKIGEGVYGEVFLHEDENNKSVIKIIPIEGTESVNGESQKKFGEILSEIVIAMELHNLRYTSTHWTDGFVKVESIKCVKGKYPDKLIELWKLYDDEKGSDNDCPSMFLEDQLYITLELGHGGQDLEGYVFHTAEQALASFEQAAVTLAIAENALQFEHRDLHWGNLLVSTTNEKSVYYKLPDREFRILTKGVKVSIIDFTLSRMSYESCCIFNDLALDPALFTAQGDYQFEIYRLMRDTIGNQWEKFEPYTNILWLHYTLDKMITEVRYRKSNLKTHKNAIAKLVSVKKQILNYESAYDFVTNCDIFAKVQRTNLR